MSLTLRSYYIATNLFTEFDLHTHLTKKKHFMGRKKIQMDPVLRATSYLLDSKAKLALMEYKYVSKQNAESRFGKEILDLERLIGELNASITELPDGGLKTASIERRDELELRRKNLKLRYPKGTDLPEVHFVNMIAVYKKQIVEAEKRLADIILEVEKKKLAKNEAGNTGKL